MRRLPRTSNQLNVRRRRVPRCSAMSSWFHLVKRRRHLSRPQMAHSSWSRPRRKEILLLLRLPRESLQPTPLLLQRPRRSPLPPSRFLLRLPRIKRRQLMQRSRRNKRKNRLCPLRPQKSKRRRRRPWQPNQPSLLPLRRRKSRRLKISPPNRTRM